MAPQDFENLVVPTDRGLYCPAGDFYIDPWRPVRRAVITHAHSDHATPGSQAYLAAADCVPLLRLRLGAGITTQALRWGETLTLGHVQLSLHPAGHVLGSAQVRLRDLRGGPVWLVTGDFKTQSDPTCAPFETVRANVLITESTFGLPIYRWPHPDSVFAEINRWRRDNAAEGATTILLTYSLGKAQRVLAGLDPSIGPIGLHGATHNCTEVYRAAGVALPPTTHANADSAPSLKGSGTVIAPPSALGSPWLRRFAGPSGVRAAFVSGWMCVRGRRRWQAVDRGFVLSDHADWPGLLDAIESSGATRVGVTHGYTEPLARWLREQRGLDTFIVPTRFTGERDPARKESDDGLPHDDLLPDETISEGQP